MQEQAQSSYTNLSKEEKRKSRENGRIKFKNMSEEDKQKLKEYGKRYSNVKNGNGIIEFLLLLLHIV